VGVGGRKLGRVRKRKKKVMVRRCIFLTVLMVIILALGFGVSYKIQSYIAMGDNKKASTPVNTESNGKQPVIDTKPNTENKSSTENKTDSSKKPSSESKPEVNEYEIVISSAGDSTLGYDDRSAFQNSLPDVLARNNNDLSYIFQNVKHIFKDDDITTVNLETTFTESKKKADKQFTFKGPASYAKILTLGDIEGVNISNNHIYDYLQQGFNDTLSALEAQEVSYFGEGHKWIKEVQGVKVGFLGYKGYWYDKAFLKKLDNDIETLEKEVDFIVVNFHWGVEGAYSPNGTQKYLAHYAVDKGADLIVGHHPHVIQGIENYKGRIIAYSLGNFAFGGNKNPKDKDTFILQVKLKFNYGELSDYKLKVIPCSISSVSHINDYKPTPMTGSKKETLLKKLNGLSVNLDFDISDKFKTIDSQSIK
jgi:poly-gamma-glutamate capsule biosynthesis protein CapA/YwtB (metallophosphatase superfamily)